jgi:hypothetical protein
VDLEQCIIITFLMKAGLDAHFGETTYTNKSSSSGWPKCSEKAKAPGRAPLGKATL